MPYVKMIRFFDAYMGFSKRPLTLPYILKGILILTGSESYSKDGNCGTRKVPNTLEAYSQLQDFRQRDLGE